MYILTSQEYTAYHQSLQDTEKWLLQISFQLMAHNSLYITNREQTQEQISQHEVCLVPLSLFFITVNLCIAPESKLVDLFYVLIWNVEFWVCCLLF
jgi:hypothetical protein